MLEIRVNFAFGEKGGCSDGKKSWAVLWDASNVLLFFIWVVLTICDNSFSCTLTFSVYMLYINFKSLFIFYSWYEDLKNVSDGSSLTLCCVLDNRFNTTQAVSNHVSWRWDARVRVYKRLSIRDYCFVSSTLLPLICLNSKKTEEKNGWAAYPLGSPKNLMSLNWVFAECWMGQKRGF